MPEDDDVQYAMTQRGWEMAEDIWFRFAYEHEDIHQIAASHGLTHDELQVLMAMALSGGVSKF